jgi:hypothetical protein
MPGTASGKQEALAVSSKAFRREIIAANLAILLWSVFIVLLLV